MTDYRKTPDHHPWSRELSAGDILTSEQNYTLDKTRLRDFGLETVCPNYWETTSAARVWRVRRIAT